MKKKTAITCAILGIGMFRLGAQTIKERHEPIVPLQTEVSAGYTSNLIFPYAIKSVDRGTADILAKKANGVENILQVKAARKNISPTNLTVITTDGMFYSFLLVYNEKPAPLNLLLGKESGAMPAVLKNGTNAVTLEKASRLVGEAKPFLHLSRKDQLLKATLRGIYLSGGVLWFTLKIKNSSLIPFQPKYLRFSLRDKQREKRTASQEEEIIPLCVRGDTSVVGGGEENEILAAFEPFTVPRTRELVIQAGEKSGGRNILLKVPGRKLLKARKL